MVENVARDGGMLVVSPGNIKQGNNTPGAGRRNAAGCHRITLLLGGALLLAGMLLSGVALAQDGPQPLDYDEYNAVVRTANRLDSVATLEPTDTDVGMLLVLGDRYGLVHVYHMTHHASKELWESKQLNGLVNEVRVADLDGDAYEDAIVATTSGGIIYVWSTDNFDPLFESLTTDFQEIHSIAFGNVDDDPATEIVLNADRHIHYIDGKTFNREWTSPYEYEATRMEIGDVDGDMRPEIVLNSGQVLDVRTGDVEWSEEVFGSRIELLDMDGDGVLEVLSESDGNVMRIFDVDHRKEKHLQ
jgi:hypothetical protein